MLYCGLVVYNVELNNSNSTTQTQQLKLEFDNSNSTARTCQLDLVLTWSRQLELVNSNSTTRTRQLELDNLNSTTRTHGVFLYYMYFSMMDLMCFFSKGLYNHRQLQTWSQKVVQISGAGKRSNWPHFIFGSLSFPPQLVFIFPGFTCNASGYPDIEWLYFQLARYTDSLLKKSTKNLTERELDEKLNEIVSTAQPLINKKYKNNK